jgi:hypoxanthine phosphoribosyltransferase
MSDAASTWRAFFPDPVPSGAEVVVSRERIRARLDVLAGEITSAYAGRELTVLGVMNGALLFMADLVRRLRIPLRIATIRAASYVGRSPGPLTLSADLDAELADRHVLIVDDILDSGATLSAVRERIDGCGPAGSRICVLLRKQVERTCPVEADWVGFDIPDAFVVGYGLDLDGSLRNLPDILRLDPEDAER